VNNYVCGVATQCLAYSCQATLPQSLQGGNQLDPTNRWGVLLKPLGIQKELVAHVAADIYLQGRHVLLHELL
jgi:hypothetical protein